MSKKGKAATPVCVGFSTSLAFWLSASFPGRAQWMMVNHSIPLSDGPSTLAAAQRVDFSSILPPGVRGVNVHVLATTRVHAGRHPSKSASLSMHVMPRDLPACSFVWLGGDLCLATPALTVVMAATYLPLAETAEVINALYGSYAIDARGQLVERMPPLVPSTLKAYLDSLPQGFPGAKRARRAAVIARPGAESPKEAALGVVMAYAMRSGAVGLGRLELNHEMPVKGKARAFIETSTVRFDGFIPHPKRHKQDKDIAYEFDSITHHSGKYFRFGSGAPGEQDGVVEVDGRDVINKDSRRRSGAWELGVHVVTLTTDDVADKKIFFAKAEQIRRLCGLGDFDQSPEMVKKRCDLHGRMLDSMRFFLRVEERLERAMQVSAHHRELAQRGRKRGDRGIRLVERNPQELAALISSRLADSPVDLSLGFSLEYDTSRSVA